MRKTALDEISLEIPDGQFIGIIGHTGSGKSTLIQHLNGLLSRQLPVRFIMMEKIFIRKVTTCSTLRSKVGLVFQYPEHQLFEVDVFSDVCFGPKIWDYPKKKWKSGQKKHWSTRLAWMKAIIRNHRLNFPADKNGVWPLQVVLAMHPEVLILDEPTAGLDPKGRDEILDQISNCIRKNGRSQLFWCRTAWKMLPDM